MMQQSTKQTDSESSLMNLNIMTARGFAFGAHAAVGQKRKYTHQDYVVHPDEVVFVGCRNKVLWLIQ